MLFYLRRFILSLFFLLLTSCGQKGPLYQPKQALVHTSIEALL